MGLEANGGRGLGNVDEPEKRSNAEGYGSGTMGKGRLPVRMEKDMGSATFSLNRGIRSNIAYGELPD